MAYVTSAVGICNLALDTLKQESIANVESPVSLTESVCARWYDNTRKELLRSHPWSFARKRAVLSRNSSSIASEFPDAYLLPNDFVRILFVGDDVYNQPEYSIEDGQILLDNGGASDLRLSYVYNVTNVLKMDSLFIDVLAMELAVKIAPALVGLKPSVQSMLVSERNRLMQQARSVNGQENPVKVIHKSGLLTAREYGRVQNARYNKVVG